MRNVHENPTQAEYGQHRKWLAQKGVRQVDIDSYFPLGGHSTMTRKDIAEKVKQMCRTFKRKTT